MAAALALLLLLLGAWVVWDLGGRRNATTSTSRGTPGQSCQGRKLQKKGGKKVGQTLNSHTKKLFKVFFLFCELKIEPKTFVKAFSTLARLATLLLRANRTPSRARRRRRTATTTTATTTSTSFLPPPPRLSDLDRSLLSASREDVEAGLVVLHQSSPVLEGLVRAVLPDGVAFSLTKKKVK